MTDLIQRIEALQASEELIAEALAQAYNRGKILYPIYSIALDVTLGRASALSFKAAALRAADGETG